jgi:hypothetical protein
VTNLCVAYVGGSAELEQACFIYDFVATVKLTQVDLYNLYADLECHFSHDQFQHFVDSVEFKSNMLPIVWYIEPTT